MSIEGRVRHSVRLAERRALQSAKNPTIREKVRKFIAPRPGKEYGESWQKVALERSIAIPAAVVATPFILGFAAWVAADLKFKESPFYVDWRIGPDGELFPCIKLKSMPNGSHARQTFAQTQELMRQAGGDRNDPRVTKSGRFLRDFDFDELPQIWLVALGYMKLFGPRAVAPYALEEMKRRAVSDPLSTRKLLKWERQYEPGLISLYRALADEKDDETRQLYELLQHRKQSALLEMHMMAKLGERIAGKAIRRVRSRRIRSEGEDGDVVEQIEQKEAA